MLTKSNHHYRKNFSAIATPHYSSIDGTKCPVLPKNLNFTTYLKPGIFQRMPFMLRSIEGALLIQFNFVNFYWFLIILANYKSNKTALNFSISFLNYSRSYLIPYYTRNSPNLEFITLKSRRLLTWLWTKGLHIMKEMIVTTFIKLFLIFKTNIWLIL